MYIHAGRNGNPGPNGPTILADLFKVGCASLRLQIHARRQAGKACVRVRRIDVYPDVPKPGGPVHSFQSKRFTRTEKPVMCPTKCPYTVRSRFPTIQAHLFGETG